LNQITSLNQPSSNTNVLRGRLIQVEVGLSRLKKTKILALIKKEGTSVVRRNEI
jgi:hypothetical protein